MQSSGSAWPWLHLEYALVVHVLESELLSAEAAAGQLQRHTAANGLRYALLGQGIGAVRSEPAHTSAEALLRLVEAYLALGLTDEAQTAGAILGYNFQSWPFYQDAYRQLRGRGLEPEARGDNWLNNVYRQMIQGRWL